MELNSKLMELAKKASSAEEIVKLGAENGYSVTPEEAEKVLSLLKGNGPLSDDEMEAVAGGMDGKGSKDPDPKYHKGQVLWVGYPSTKNFLKVTIVNPEFYTKEDGWRYYVTNEYGFDENYYLETRGYIQTSDPHGVWPY